jgi:hypothetical protein
MILSVNQKELIANTLILRKNPNVYTLKLTDILSYRISKNIWYSSNKDSK